MDTKAGGNHVEYVSNELGLACAAGVVAVTGASASASAVAGDSDESSRGMLVAWAIGAKRSRFGSAQGHHMLYCCVRSPWAAPSERDG